MPALQSKEVKMADTVVKMMLLLALAQIALAGVSSSSEDGVPPASWISGPSRVVLGILLFVLFTFVAMTREPPKNPTPLQSLLQPAPLIIIGGVILFTLIIA